MSKLEKILALVRSINEDEFQEQLTHGDSLDDVYEELLFLAEKIESKKKRTAVIVDHISNCFAGDFFNYLPISDAHDELDVFCMGFNTYIEELKSAMVSKKLVETINEKLVEEKERTEELTISRDQFLSNVSHEIRTPLNGVIGFTDLLLKNATLGPEEKSQLEYIKMSGDILLVIINDILDLAKMESKQVEFLNKPFNLNQLTRLVHDTFSLKAAEKEIDFKISIDEELPAILNGDSVRVTQILFNLINNAIKFTPVNGKIKLKLQFQDEEDDFYIVRIVVKDTGIGIPADKLHDIFTPFIQLGNNSGAGLGLTIIKKIIDMMKGDIQVESKVGVGTKFTVTLPFPKTDYFSDSKLLLNKDKSVLAPVDKDKKIKILLAEDNRINQILVQKVLSKFNMECIAVANGQQAIDAITHEDFDLILMDLMMPVMNGYEATSAIRNMRSHAKKNVPIVALSAVVTSSVTEACKAVGINKYISKPFDSEELYNVIIEMLEKE
ncbi:ATP-binding protein [Flavobacterium seoulense]|uniref:histidine kinase n=1 Tax=Flavobacterium seoulense TaxID=1492738 RepID=A0A066WK92_9FLAO|nr:ATP-binding protein [Flavobacterium seoulense]KDN54261.1 signal transduction histidine kinase [Flavobacterium seoulense]